AARAAAAARARPADAAIPQAEIASSSSTDADARRLKLRGEIARTSEAVELKRRTLAEFDEQIRTAETDLRRFKDQFDTAAAAHGRRLDGARRRHDELREELSQLRAQRADLDADIADARIDLARAALSEGMVSEQAWALAIERHVGPDNRQLRDRARITGYAGTYDSATQLAEAIADIHDHIYRQGTFRAVLTARTREDFDSAASALPGGLEDLPFDHGRPLARGFSNDLDQTEEPTSLTESRFSLRFVQGRVVISHIYPYVPHRRLTTADFDAQSQ
ncbi:MAG TPA: hypothetical protein VFP68_16775, partial [Burkholderiaceae bacterium]|nr:hypothetical protein [Burkholderiaceae bacterium]